MALGWSCSVVNDPYGTTGSTPSCQYLPPIQGSAGGVLCSPAIVKWKWNTRIQQNGRSHIKEFSDIVSIWKLIFLNRRQAVLEYHTGKLTVSANPEKLKDNMGQRLTSCDKPNFTIYRGHTTGSQWLWIPPQEASSSSIPMDYEPVVPAHHHRGLVDPANLWIGSQ
jgi:hypothetical protein